MTILPNTAKTNDKGHLEIGGCDTVALAAEFGTPLYVLDEETIRHRCQQYKNEFQTRYPNTQIIYACKALCTTAVLKIMESEGLGLDVSSGGELYTALKAKCNPKNIYFHGNNKSLEELREGVAAGVGHFVVDNFQELENLEKLQARVNLLLRINPGIEAHTHEFISTGRVDSKFGFPQEQIKEAVRLAKRMNFLGFHAHIGSQILEVKPFEVLAELLLSLAEKHEASEINLGGGLGIAYTENVSPPSIATFAKAVTAVLKNKTQIKLVVEPGRSVVGTAGVTFYRIGAIKDIPAVRKYVMVDGGMADNIRPMLYGAHYTAKIANGMNPCLPAGREEPVEKVTLAGRFCESGDVLIKDINLPKLEVNDIIGVFCTGAYNYSMASNYNRVGRPAMVLVSGGNATLIVKRESYEDLTANDFAL